MLRTSLWDEHGALLTALAVYKQRSEGISLLNDCQYLTQQAQNYFVPVSVNTNVQSLLDSPTTICDHELDDRDTTYTSPRYVHSPKPS